MKHSSSVTLVSLTLALVACGGSTHGDSIKPANAYAAHTTQAGVSPTLAASDYANVVQQLYVSYFGRPADTGGFANFKSQMAGIGAPNDIELLIAAYDSDARVKSLIDSFGSSTESTTLYGGDNTAFVSAVYNNILGRAPDVDGLAFWVGALNGGGLSRARASLDIMAGALRNTSEQGKLDARLVNAKVTVATIFTDKLIVAPVNGYSGDAAAARARTMLSAVRADTGSYDELTTSFVRQIAVLPLVPTFTLNDRSFYLAKPTMRVNYVVSGTCFGAVTDNRVAHSQVEFDGTMRNLLTTTSSWQLSNCSQEPFSTTESTYYDSNYNLAGSAVYTASFVKANGIEFVTFTSPTTPLPAKVSIGNSGTIGSANVYTASDKQSAIGTRDFTYVIEADDGKPTAAIANFITRTFNPAGQLLLTTQTKYRLSSGTMIPIAEDIQYATTSTLHLVKKAQPINPSAVDVVIGNGAEVSNGKVVTVHYTGWLYDPTLANRHGARIATSIGGAPFTFTTGTGSVITGWEMGVAGMKVGGKRTLILTSGLAYGGNGNGTEIPPNAGLVFDIEVLGVK